MSLFDRIAQLTAQLQDAREQASRDSATIARLHARNEELDGLRALAQAASSPSPELLALLDRGLKYGIVGCDCYSSTNCVEADEIRKLIREVRA